MMIGIGTPSSQSRTERPTPIFASYQRMKNEKAMFSSR
jgi:hypothetical protein